MRKTVADLMSVDFVTVTARMSLEDALNLLVESELSELCVVDDTGRLTGIVTDFDLLKARLNAELLGQSVSSMISRAVTLLPADALMDQAVPLFREGSCSRAYVCRDGQLLGRLSRIAVLKYLTQQNDSATEPPAIRNLPVVTVPGQNATLQFREATPRAPQFLSGSVLGGLCADRSRPTA
jgi:CBS-domain-containing membrane protein